MATFAATPEDSVSLVVGAIKQASLERADLIFFPECYVPGYRAFGKPVPPPDPAFLERAWTVIAAAAGEADVGVVLGTERCTGNALMISALVIGRDGRWRTTCEDLVFMRIIRIRHQLTRLARLQMRARYKMRGAVLGVKCVMEFCGDEVMPVGSRPHNVLLQNGALHGGFQTDLFNHWKREG